MNRTVDATSISHPEFGMEEVEEEPELPSAWRDDDGDSEEPPLLVTTAVERSAARTKALSATAARVREERPSTVAPEEDRRVVRRPRRLDECV